jgi:hypothetical protein
MSIPVGGHDRMIHQSSPESRPSRADAGYWDRYDLTGVTQHLDRD